MEVSVNWFISQDSLGTSEMGYLEWEIVSNKGKQNTRGRLLCLGETQH